MKIKTVVCYCICAGAFATTPMTLHSMQLQKNLISYGKRLLTKIPIGFVLAWLNTYFHELGHASASYALTGNPTHIYVGASSPTSDLLVTPLGTINGFSPFNGYTSIQFFSPWQRILISIAGPLLGILFSTGISYAINPFYQKLTLSCKIFLRALYAMNVLQFIPTKKTGESDGYQILEALGMSESTLKIVQTYTDKPLNVLIAALFSFGPIFEEVKAMFEAEKQTTIV